MGYVSQCVYVYNLRHCVVWVCVCVCVGVSLRYNTLLLSFPISKIYRYIHIAIIVICSCCFCCCKALCWSHTDAHVDPPAIDMCVRYSYTVYNIYVSILMCVVYIESLQNYRANAIHVAPSGLLHSQERPDILTLTCVKPINTHTPAPRPGSVLYPCERFRGRRVYQTVHVLQQVVAEAVAKLRSRKRFRVLG